MTPEEYEAKVLAAEAWARDEIGKLSLRPVSVCPKPEDHLYEVARLHAQIARIEAVMRDACESLDSSLYGIPRRSPASPQAEALLKRLEA